MKIDWFATWYVWMCIPSNVYRSEMQISVTMDYAADSQLASFFTGGLKRHHHNHHNHHDT